MVLARTSGSPDPRRTGRMRRINSLRSWCLVALLTLPVAASGAGGGKAQDPPPRRQHHHRQRLPAGRSRRPPPRRRDPAAARGGEGPAADRGHQPGAGRRVHPGPALLRPVRQGDRPPRRRRLRPHPLRPERRRQAGGVRGQLPQGLCRADRPAAPGLPAGDHRPDDDHPLHDPRARRGDQRAHPQGGRVGTPAAVRRVYALPGRARRTGRTCSTTAATRSRRSRSGTASGSSRSSGVARSW